MPVRPDSPPYGDDVALALKVLAAQGLEKQAARAALNSMARERGVSLTRCAALVVAAVNGRVN
ncbi:hypothetical protein BS329_09155 [Amycolatopsis coloradensis]|uniref:ANTAR domain-containing protein n=1 Tax=Amycolatopsis coloradensis TaxID=76021 RepID=A0A1R0KZ78_9PSEU|nr:hypothetical protein [Amycolatopsis coloradensis]OLZ54663.1 hypothetical protein BS329_09155 [Amycolatopsis coloradensis]